MRMKLIDKNIVLNKIKQVMHYKEREAKQFLCQCLDVSLTELTLMQGVTKKQYFLVYKCIVLTRFGKPINKILKREYFYGRKFFVNNNVLAPRSETERVVDYALKEIEELNRYKGKAEQVKVLDLCTGSGIMGITIAKQNAKTCVTLADVSNKALKVAEKNAIDLGADVRIVRSNMFDAISDKFDIIVSNPPYISKADYKKLPKEVKNYDPKIALVGGVDGLDFYREICKKSCDYLTKNGVIVLEIGFDQKESIKEIFSKHFESVDVFEDYEGNARVAVIKGEKK